MNRRRALLACCVLQLTLIAGVVYAASRAADPESSPLLPGGGWKAALVACGLLSAIAYLAILVLLRSGGPIVPVLVVSIALQLVPLLGPTLLSRDAYAYWAYARVATAHGGNPYDDVPGQWPDDPATIRMGGSWREEPSLYGPAFTLLSQGVASAVGRSPVAAALSFRVLAALSIVAIVLLAALLARNQAFAAALVGLNPLVALHFAGGGHNDALMMALVLAALWLHRARRTAWSGLSWALAAQVKWVPLAFLGLVVLGGRVRKELHLLAWALAWLLAFAAVSTVVYGLAWVGAAQRLSEQARRTSSIGLSGWLGDAGLAHRPTLAVIGVLTICAATLLAVQAWRGRVRLGLAGVLAAALQGWLNPWYALWGLALSAPEEDRTAHVLAVVLSLFLLTDALPYV